MAKILVIHGPNLNRLGLREPKIYGHTTLEELNVQLSEQAKQQNVDVICFQSNAENELIEKIQQAPTQGVGYILINPAALGHTSIGLRDALLASALPFIEVHLSNVHARESFRHHSFLADKAVGVVTGLGIEGYLCALSVALKKFKPQ